MSNPPSKKCAILICAQYNELHHKRLKSIASPTQSDSNQVINTANVCPSDDVFSTASAQNTNKCCSFFTLNDGVDLSSFRKEFLDEHSHPSNVHPYHQVY